MNCNCIKTIFVNGLTDNGKQNILVPSSTISEIEDLSNAYLIIACGLKANDNNPVYLQLENDVVPILTKYGNNVVANQLKKRTRYYLLTGTNNADMKNGHLIIQNNLCCPVAINNCTIRTIKNEERK